MSTFIEAPLNGPKVTIVLPNALLSDARNSEATVQVKRTMLGRTITYVKTSDRTTLQLPLSLTRQKSLELEAFLNIYQSAEWLLKLHDDSTWAAKLIGEPVSREAVDRIGGEKPTITGTELIDVTLTLSCKRIS